MNIDIVSLFKEYYKDKDTMNLSRLDQLYSADLVFRDPIHEIKGLVSMQDYLADMYSNVEECRFEFLDEVSTDGSAYIKWNMHYRHPKLSSSKLLTVRGMSQIMFNDRIYYHEDIYDMGAMVYEHVPVVGGLTRWLKQRLSS